MDATYKKLKVCVKMKRVGGLPSHANSAFFTAPIFFYPHFLNPRLWGLKTNFDNPRISQDHTMSFERYNQHQENTRRLGSLPKTYNRLAVSHS